MKTKFWLCLLSLCALLGCSGRRLPPGTPPPEYEPPIVVPWAPAGADAGLAPAAEPTGDAPNSLDAGAGAELSLDAGPR